MEANKLTIGMVKFNTTKEEAALITKIVERAKKNDVSINKLNSILDITATHCNGNPLRLATFLHADNFNFNHDFYGIRENLDRNSGKLLNCFLPRFSK